MCTLCALMSSSSSFYHVLGLWQHIMWHVMWLHCHVPLHCSLKKKEKKFKRKRNIKSRKIDKRKRKMLVSTAFHNTDLWNNLGFSLCAALSVYHIVATSDDGKKFEMRVSTDWYVVVATTRQNSTCSMLTSAKLSVGYLVVGITRELNKKPSLHYYLIYISYKWSVL